MRELETPVVDTYPSPINLPEGKSGKVEIVHKYGRNFTVVPWREVMLLGREHQEITLDQPRRIHQLLENGQLWVQDIPVEVRQHRDAIARLRPWGRVLVGGLGLGMAAHMLAEIPAVDEIVVVERSAGVIKLCDPHLPKVHVVHADLLKWLGTLSKREAATFTCGFLDLWTTTSEGAWWEEVFPLRRLIGRRFGAAWNASMQYWAEDIMLAQVGANLMHSPPRYHWYYRRGLRLPMSSDQALAFVWTVGTPAWERRYGRVYPQLRLGAPRPRTKR